MSERRKAARVRREEITAKIDAALDEVLDATWRTADEWARMIKKDHPELRRHFDTQRLGARLSARARRGEVEKRGPQAGYDNEWRKA